MGTNFFLPENHILAQGMTEDQRHVGKASAGWKFLFQSHPHIVCLDGWKALLNKVGEVETEYGEIRPLDDFWKMVEETQSLRTHKGYVQHGPEWVHEDRGGYEFGHRPFF